MLFGGEVELVPWPQGERRRRASARAGRPCLLLVPPDELPPADLSPAEDWVRTTADPIEVHLRGERLRQAHAQVDHHPRIEDGGILRVGGRWAPLGVGDVPIVAALVQEFRRLVPREVLRAAAGESVTNAALSVRLFRLRPTLASVGLAVTTVRARGYVLDVAPSHLFDDGDPEPAPG